MGGGRMNRILLLCFFVVLLILPKAVMADDASPWEKKLPFENAIIEYAITGIEEGQETLYIRDHGNQRATYHETVSKMMGMTVPNSTVELITPDYIYSYDLQNREGVKTTNPQKYMIDEYNKLSTAEKEKVLLNAEKMGSAYIDKMGGDGMTGKVQQNAAEILGYSCDKVEVMGGNASYLIHGTDILLKSDIDMMGMKMSLVATSVKKDDAEDKFFQHPAGINAEMDEEADAMAKEMAGRTVAMLKDPENAPQSLMQPMGFPGKMEGMSEEEKQMMQQAEKMMQGIKGVRVQ